MVDLAAKKNALLQVDFHKRYDPYNIDAMRKVREGKLGEPYYAYAYMEDKIVVPTKWLAQLVGSEFALLVYRSSQVRSGSLDYRSRSRLRSGPGPER